MALQWLLLPIFLTPLCGLLELELPFKNRKARDLYIMAPVAVTSVFLFVLIPNRPAGTLHLLRLTEHLSLALRMDALSCVFCALIAFLWPLATLYAFEYMEHEHHQQRFFGFYMISYGVTVGVALSANLITMYLFYELLTLATLPLVAHELDEKAVYAGEKYIIYSISGAALSFVGIMFLFNYGNMDLNFVYGGVLSATSPNRHLLLLGFFFTFVGFGVKAAVFPLHGWLPTAGVAPTPVTALLHAVAVVKSGVFAIIRSSFFSFGPSFLWGSWAQQAALAVVVFTILFGSAMAFREQHFKRRLAYSTVSNLSYILYGVLLLTPEGLTAGLAHMLFHGLMKIVIFFCAGTVLCKTGREYVDELEGIGRKMPFTFSAYALASAALAGVPLLPGFLSKFRLIVAGMDVGGAIPVAGVAVLMVSTLLTACYLFIPAVFAFFPRADFDMRSLSGVPEAGWRMLLPYAVLCAVMIITGCFGAPLIELLSRVAAGMV